MLLYVIQAVNYVDRYKDNCNYINTQQDSNTKDLIKYLDTPNTADKDYKHHPLM
jgi:hypothetical protein